MSVNCPLCFPYEILRYEANIFEGRQIFFAQKSDQLKIVNTNFNNFFLPKPNFLRLIKTSLKSDWWKLFSSLFLYIPLLNSFKTPAVLKQIQAKFDHFIQVLSHFGNIYQNRENFLQSGCLLTLKKNVCWIVQYPPSSNNCQNWFKVRAHIDVFIY